MFCESKVTVSSSNNKNKRELVFVLIKAGYVVLRYLIGKRYSYFLGIFFFGNVFRDVGASKILVLQAVVGRAIMSIVFISTVKRVFVFVFC